MKTHLSPDSGIRLRALTGESLQSLHQHFAQQGTSRPLSVATGLAQVANSTKTLHPNRAWKSQDTLKVPGAREMRGSPTQWRYVEQSAPSAPPASELTRMETLQTPASASPAYLSRSSSTMAVHEYSASQASLEHPSPTAGLWEIDAEPLYVHPRLSMSDGHPQQLLGCQLNDMHLPQSDEVAQVYRVEPRQVTGGRPLQSLAFDTDMLVRSNGQQRRYLFTMESREAAIEYGEKHYGVGNFELFRLDTRGMPAVRYRSHVQFALLFDDTGPLDGEGGRAYQRGDVYLDTMTLQANRVHRESQRRFDCCTVS